MCDRYTITCPPDMLEKIFGIKESRDYTPSFNAGPTQELPVILNTQPNNIINMTWGLISKWSNNKSISPKLFNLTVNQAFEKRMYQKGLRENRCVIPADGFYLWKQIGKAKRVPYYFHLPERKPFGIAGLWESYEDMDGNPTNTFIMMMRSATNQVEPYQEDMPLILSDTLLNQWLDAEFEVTEHAQSFMNASVDKLKFHSVAPLISNLNQNHEGLIKAALPSDQHGNYTLFN
ncbi:MAG: SOS response-associated peptidase [Bacteroidota bacterium]